MEVTYRRPPWAGVITLGRTAAPAEGKRHRAETRSIGGDSRSIYRAASKGGKEHRQTGTWIGPHTQQRPQRSPAVFMRPVRSALLLAAVLPMPCAFLLLTPPRSGRACVRDKSRRDKTGYLEATIAMGRAGPLQFTRIIPEIHRVGPEVSSWPSSFTRHPY